MGKKYKKGADMSDKNDIDLSTELEEVTDEVDISENSESYNEELPEDAVLENVEETETTPVVAVELLPQNNIPIITRASSQDVVYTPVIKKAAVNVDKALLRKLKLDYVSKTNSNGTYNIKQSDLTKDEIDLLMSTGVITIKDQEIKIV